MADSKCRKQWKDAKGKLHKVVAKTLPKKDLGPNLDTHAKYSKKVEDRLKNKDTGKSAAKDVDSVLKAKKKIDAAVKEYDKVLANLVRAGDPSNDVTQDVISCHNELKTIDKEVSAAHSKLMKEWGNMRQT